MLDWLDVAGPSDLSVVPDGSHGLMLVGREDCEPCERALAAVQTFAESQPNSVALAFKITKAALTAERLVVHNDEVRFFPTIIGFSDGDEVFRIKGLPVSEDISPIQMIEARFRRAVDRLRNPT